ncbi:MAG: nucleoside monophosphate kinase [Candidatus Dependentiae bacterium]|nr:nucleoside monophosphate kinase [Candidatus Dependentiae bacterium]
MKKIAVLFLCLVVHQSFGLKHFVLLSAPGSGKGTFSQYMVEKYGYIQICPGDMYRDEIKQQTELGKRIQAIVDRGDYVDEETTCALVGEKLSKALDNNNFFIIDGFPRNEFAFQFLYNFLQQR